jgi:hypothetical protein
VSGPDREKIARSRRRQEALDSLAFERQREEALLQRLEPIVRDAEAWRIDEAALAAMDAADREFLREIGFAQPRPPDDAMARFEARIAELEAQLEDCRRRQTAFEAYAKALEEPS